MDANARFDLIGLNAVSIPDVFLEAQTDGPDALRHLVKQAELLLPRVREETGTKEAASQLLRLQVERWYLHSGDDPDPTAGRTSWRGWATAAWWGLFYESKVPGGSRTPRIADRLLWVSEGKAGPHPGRWHLPLARPAEEPVSPTLNGRHPDEVMLLRAAQAILDDLADTPRGPATSVPLPRLADLSESTSAHDVNLALQTLLPTYDRNSFLLLDPIRTPGVGLVTVEWPSGHQTSGGSPYRLELDPTSAGDGEAADSDGTDGPAGSLRFYLPKWYGVGRPREEWVSILSSLADKQARLPAPPAAICRQSPGYQSLRAALIAGSPATELFGRAGWRGRPLDLPLLNRLLKDGSFVPEEDTDASYLEAELNDTVYGDPRHTASDGVWTIGEGRVVRRHVDSTGAVRYVLDDGAAGSTPPADSSAGSIAPTAGSGPVAAPSAGGPATSSSTPP